MKSPITTHVLDTTLGKPAAGVKVILELYYETEGWRELASGTTDGDGRITNLLDGDSPLPQGVYRLTFETGDYFRATGSVGFYPYVSIVFQVHDTQGHYHVPLLLSPYGYSTYRGS
ncbi:MAG TPA: hydroxyisourate hydrolase [Bacteroidota bacterium]|nr:hydroxyisourate hydrolase [Bacteroidota bacterium]